MDLGRILLTAAADVVVVVHFLFIVFVLLGGALVLRRPRLAWVHAPAALWGALIEFAGWYCPLTPLENTLRAAAGGQPYTGGYIARYLLPLIYPDEMDRIVQIALGLVVIAINGAVYGALLQRRRRARRPRPPTSA